MGQETDQGNINNVYCSISEHLDSREVPLTGGSDKSSSSQDGQNGQSNRKVVRNLQSRFVKFQMRLKMRDITMTAE